MPLVLVIFLCILFTAAGISINLNRFWQYEAGYYDFGIFDHALWQAAHFKAPIIDHFIVPGRWIFADHFNPSIFLLVPFYWIWDKSEVLMIAQDVLVGASGFVLFLIGNKILKNQWISLAVVATYFLFTGLQNAVYSDFHELTAMTFFLMMLFWSVINGHKRWYFVFLILVLGFKESLFLLGVGLSFFLYFYDRKWRRVAFATLLISIVWGVTVIKFVIPYFSGGIYGYYSEYPKTIPGILNALVTPPLKVRTVFLTLLSFSFLPLLNPISLPILILNFITRFLTDGSTRWDLGLHYSAEIAPTLAVSTLLGLHFLQKRISRVALAFVACLMLFISVFLYRFILHPPFGLAYNKAFYKHTKDFTFLDTMIARVPSTGSIAAQNNLASRFLHRQIWILGDNYREHNPDYILIDTHDGQNINNFLGIADYHKLLHNIKEDGDYKVVYNKGDQYIFQRR